MSVEERRALLIEAAISAMARDGVAATGTRAIVAEAGMAIGVFHYCFRSKDELVIEVVRTLNQRAFAAAGELLRSSNDPATVLRGALEAYWDHVENHPEERMLLFELTQYSLRSPERRCAAREQYDTYVSGLSRFLHAVSVSGGFTWRRDVDLVARSVLAQLQGVTMQWLVNGDSDQARALLGLLGDSLVAAIDEQSA